MYIAYCVCCVRWVCCERCVCCVCPSWCIRSECCVCIGCSESCVWIV